MDIITDVKKWLKVMGYDRNVDDINFKGMITPATTHIWMQLIKNVCSKQEIGLIRKNIIINRLSSKRGLPPGMSEIIKVHPLKELDIYNKKQELEKRLGILKHRVQENEEKIKELMMQNRIKYATVDNLKYETESSERVTFLLKAKTVQLKKEVTRIEDILHSVKSLTPVEEINSTDEKEVLDTLKTCAQKLEVHVKQQKINDENSAVFRINPTINSTFLDNSIFVRMSAKKKMSSAKKQLIPPQSRKALTPRALDSVYNDMPDLGKTFLSVNDESFLIGSGNISNIDITFNESKVKETLQGLVHSYNRRLIWNCLQQIFTECKTEVSKFCINTDEGVTKRDTKNLGIVKLYHVHVKNELLARKHEVTIRSLETEIEKFKNMVLVQANNFNQAKTVLEYQMKVAGLRAALKFMQKEVGKESSLTTNENEMVSLNEKLHNVKEQIKLNLWDIEQYLNCFKTANNKILRTRDCTVSLVEKLNHFVEDSDWTEPLSKNLHIQEIDAFSCFPLEQNRTTMFGNRKVNIRDLCTSSIPYQKDIGKDTLYKFVSVIHKPCCFPEKILYEIAEAMVRVENFEKLKSRINDEENVSKYSLRQLKETENHMEKSLQNFNRLIENDASKMTASLGKLKEMVDVWLEMPFGRYISKNRLVNQHNFEFYERQYDYYYNQL